MVTTSTREKHHVCVDRNRVDGQHSERVTLEDVRRDTEGVIHSTKTGGTEQCGAVCLSFVMPALYLYERLPAAA